MIDAEAVTKADEDEDKVPVAEVVTDIEVNTKARNVENAKLTNRLSTSLWETWVISSRSAVYYVRGNSLTKKPQ